MSNPEAKAADTQEEQVSKTEESKELTFADRVEQTVNVMTKDDKGNWVLPEGEEMSEELQYAALAEKRRRDTQASYTSTNQRVKALEAEKSALLSKAIGNVELNLTPEQEEELEDLKFSDPDAWRKQMNKYETAAVSERQKELDEEIKKVSDSSLDEQEKERRKDVLTSFLAANDGFELNDDIIANDIPPRITNKLANNDITFEEFLEECLQYTKTGKVVKQTETTNKQPNLNKVGGSSTPGDNAVKEDAIKSYETETY